MILKFVLLMVMVLPPLPRPHPTAVEALSRLPDKKAEILKSAENKAPIPDALKGRFVEVEIFETKSGVEIVLEAEKDSELVRLPGPSYAWPHGNCLMCLGNHLILECGQSKKYLDEIGHENWGVLYDNLYNDPEYKGVEGSNEGWYGGSSYSRQRIFNGRFRRWR